MLRVLCQGVERIYEGSGVFLRDLCGFYNGVLDISGAFVLQWGLR